MFTNSSFSPESLPSENTAGKSLKSALRENLIARHEPADWLDGLLLVPLANEVHVYFLHSLFARWFNVHKKAIFEDTLLECRKKRRLLPVYGQLPKIMPGYPETGKTFEQHANFDDFIDNGKNSMAMKAAKKAVAFNLGKQPSPLVFYGPGGCGKTLLLSIIRHALEQRLGVSRVICHNAADFCISGPYLSKAMHEKSFWLSHILLLDNLQEIAGQKNLQERLANCLDYVHSGLVVFCWSGQQPDRLENRLTTRLAQGLLIKLEPPDLESRLKFLERKRPELSKSLSLWLARQSSTFPELLGLLHKLDFFVETNGKLPDPEQLEKLNSTQPLQKAPGWRQITEAVGKNLDIKVEDILGSERKAEIVQARQTAMFLCRRHLGLSYPEIGRIFGGKDHSTVMHSIKKMERLYETDKVTHNLLTQLENSGFT